ncbi:MAG: DsbA family protein [Anaerolineales bacterium]|nr:DsbA family protein [Anaerolineales bacterium]
MSKREEIRQRRQQQQRRTILTGVILIAGVALIVTALVILRTQAAVSGIVVPDYYDYPQQTQGTTMGDPNAPVVIEEFSDFQCSACEFFHDETLAQVIESYVKTGEVFFVYRSFPVIDARAARKESQTAALASYCAAEQDRFWEFHDLLFANRIGENAGSFTIARLEAMADTLELDASFERCLGEERYLDLLREDMELGAQVGVNSTPSFLINGKLVVGAYPFEQFAIEIDQALAEVEN